ncbi:MAG: hypothetical protein C0168_05165 [Candidatus Aminicenantes bacterium]|nr:MAG: hypothetical protein C0168_05165 [Candidatus Aminicenantes bacterium]
MFFSNYKELINLNLKAVSRLIQVFSPQNLADHLDGDKARQFLNILISILSVGLELFKIASAAKTPPTLFY